MYNILVCDDEKDIVSALRIYLMSEGYQVFEAYNGKEALEVLEKWEMSHAVDERMKSERFKTELITNVSHDIKTPLTSIINYVDGDLFKVVLEFPR